MASVTLTLERLTAATDELPGRDQRARATGQAGSLHTVALVLRTRSKGHVCWWSIWGVRGTRRYGSPVPVG
jgi:hypothetical protein